jgi:membrane associated rhomboid family serine protease
MIPLKDNIPTRRFPVVTVAIIVANCLIYLYMLSLGRMRTHYIYALGAIPYEFTHFTDVPSYPEVFFPFTLFSSMFMHGSLFHLGGNMLYLWIFGDNVEDTIGRGRFIVFYLSCGLIAATSHILANPDSMLPMVGASGAISGILGAYLLLYPRARVLILLFFFFFVKLIEIPAMVVLGFWVIVQLLNSTRSLGPSTGGIAWFAHIGGFLSGLFLIQIFYKKAAHVH